jgi:tetratricopeptide (TPR) repeat protein
MFLDYFVSEFQRIDPECTADEIADALWLAAQGLFPFRVAMPTEPHGRRAAEGPNDVKLSDGDLKQSSKGKRELNPKLSEKIQTKPSTAPLLTSVHGSAGEGAFSGTVGGLLLRVPAAQALPGVLQLARAFRPLMRRVASRTQVQIDEEQTVRRIAEERILMPVLTAERARWLDVALVIDSHSSMLIWQQTVREMRQLLEHQGAFRDVRTWTLNTSAPTHVVLQAGTHRVVRKPRELIDPSGRRAIIIASNCLGPAWSGTGAAEIIRTLGTHNSVVLWQMLPQPLWRQTALRSAQVVHVSATEMVAPNCRLHSELWRPAPGEEIARELALPVVTAEPHRVRAWARLLSGAPRLRLPAIIMRPAPPSEEGIEEEDEDETAAASKPLPERRILNFRKNASPPAFKLACVLAGAPLRLPIMRLVQRTMLPNSEQIHLAEVFLSGLIERVTAEDSSVDPDFVDYDFCAGIRAKLLDASWFPQVLEVQTVVSDYLMRHFGQALDFQAILADPESAQPVGSGPADKRFASITTEVLRRLGGKYAEAADRLDRLGHAAELGRTADRFGLESGETTTQLQPDRNAFEGIAILWVDDYPKNNVWERKKLENARACITPSLSTQEALESLSEHRFDAIISDLGRAEGAFEGFRLLEQIRAQGSQIPFAIYAGTRALKFAGEALRKGALVSTNEFDEVRNYLSHALETAQPGGLLSDAQWHRLQIKLAKSSEGQVVVGILRRDPHEPAWDEIWNSVNGEGIEALAVAIIAAVAGTGYCQLWRVQEGRILLVAQAVDRGLATHEEASWQGLIGRAAKSNRVVYASNVDEEIGYIPTEPSTRSEVSIPISVNGAEVAEGVINIESPKLGAFAGRQIQWLELLARSLASRWVEVTAAGRRADRSLDQRGRLKQSEADYDEGNRINPQDADVHYNLGNLLAEQGRAEEAEKAYREVLRINPRYADAHYNLGNLLAEQGRAEEAEKAYREVLWINPRYADAHYNLGYLLAKQNRAEAEKAYREVLWINPRYADAHYNLGNLLAEQGRLGEAEKAYREALQISSQNADANYNLGNLLAEQGRLGEAEKAYRKALWINPRYADAYVNLGILLAEQGRTEEAERAYGEALRINPQDADARMNLGILLKEQGRAEETEEVYRETPSLPEEAEKAYREALRINPQDADAHYNLGKLFEAQAQFADAEKEYRECIRCNPDRPEAYIELGKVLRKLDRKREEKEVLDKAEEIMRRGLFQGYTAPYVNELCHLLVEQGRREEADAIIQFYDRAPG